MSLILEALKKLERERDTSGRGFLVVSHAPWPSSRFRLARLALMAGLIGVLAGAGAWMALTLMAARDARPALASPPPADSPRPGRVVAAPSVQPAAAALPPPIWASPQARPAAAAPPAPAAPVAASPDPGPELLVIAPRNPPPASAAAPSAAWKLEAISAQNGEPVAVVNGRVVRKGDTVDGALVTWIGGDAVEIEVDGRRRVLGF